MGLQGSGGGPRSDAVTRGALMVSGDEDLSGEIADLSLGMRPPLEVVYVSQDALEAALRATVPEVLVVCLRQLDTAGADWIRHVVASARLPVIALVGGAASQRAALREQAREAGAIDCLLRAELSAPLLEAALIHARSYSHQTGQLAELHERFALAAHGARDGIWDWDIARNRVHYSQRWRDILGLRSDLPPDLEVWLSRVHPQDLARLRADLEAAVNGETPVHEHEHRVRDGEGNWRWVSSRAVIHRGPDGRARRMAGSLTDITPYRQREAMVREQSRRDALTQLPDRRVFLERCARVIELSRAHEDYMFVVLMVAVDRLGQIRDSYGLDASDEAVSIIAKRLEACLRPEDQMFRFSTTKFAILLEDVEDPSFGTALATRIHDAVAIALEIQGNTVFPSVSIGMTSSAHGYVRVEEVVTDVSAATDSARDRGRNRHEVYDSSMRIETRTLLALEMALRRAIEREEFRLHYQPLVRIDTNELVGFEALLRWEHPERGRISPAEFIPVAEDTGMIIPIGRWVIQEAIRTLVAWHAEFDVPGLAVSVNLSAKQIGEPLLLETIDVALAESGLSPSCLKLELTESVMMDRVDEVTEVLQAIRSRGVQLWVDDFGTGYSSLGYLHRFPVDGLKIDRSFVSELDGSEESATMVRTIIALASNLGLDLVAEGIETEVQARQLEQLGCALCQGYLLGKPMPAEEIRALLRG